MSRIMSWDNSDMPDDSQDGGNDGFTSDLERWFEEYNDEFLEFGNISESERLHRRPDLCAFLYLDKKLGGEGDIIDWAGHDEIALDFPNLEKLTKEDVLYIIRCGILYKDDTLYSFV